MLYAGGGLSVMLAAIFVLVILWHYARLAVQRRSLGRTIFSGGCLLPLFFWIYILSIVPVRVDDLGSSFCMMCGLSGFVAFLGALAGFLTAVLIEAARLGWASIGISRRKRRSRIRETAVSSPRQLDDDVTPLEMPPSYFLPRRFGVRGMLVLVTLASVLMAFMQAVRVPAGVFLSVVVFVAGVLGGQVLLFRGRKPQTASAWVGAFLLPGEAIVATVMSHLVNNGDTGDIPWLIARNLGGCICTVPAGIVLGTVTGIIAGGTYAQADGFCRRLFGGLPRIQLASATADDIDRLLAWVPGPRFLQRWSAGQLTFPLDRRQLLQRLDAAQGEQSCSCGACHKSP
jgi:hypothetical protein